MNCTAFIALGLFAAAVTAADRWDPMPMISKDALAAGISPGGEGCQAPRCLAIDQIDGRFILYGTDVGGMFRSVDGGKHFQACNVGMETCGLTGFAIDPRNPRRCLAIGDGGQNESNIYGGIHLSIDQGASWRRVCTKMCQDGAARQQLAYDPSSWDAKRGYCMVAYWIEEGNPKERGGRLYRSIDGGEAWTEGAASSAFGGGDGAHSLIAVHPKGWVLIANTSGVWRSTDGGATFTQARQGEHRSLDVAGDTIWTASGTAISRSADGGAIFTDATAIGITRIANLQVSPVEPKNMLANDAGKGWRRCFSADGGVTWKPCGRDMKRSWIPNDILYDDKTRSFAWHPKDALTFWGVGPGDIISTSHDGGATVQWAGNGDNGIMLGGGFNLSAQDPQILYFGSQDYNGALTTDGGRSWGFINLSKDSPDGDPWGWVYGGYSPDGKILFGGNRAFQKSEYELWITYDGGARTQKAADRLAGIQVSYGDPIDAQVLFCWNQRSTDGGRTWASMPGCDGVCTHQPASKALFGGKGSTVVASTDHGATWTAVATLPEAVRDVAAARDGTVWAVGGGLFRCAAPDFRPRRVDCAGCPVGSVAVDPRDPRRIYACGTIGNWRKLDSCMVRSLDGGSTWEKLCNRTDLGADGGNCASWCRVHPVSGEVWVGTCCYGFWRFIPGK